jgi:N utilization substance protein B
MPASSRRRSRIIAFQVLYEADQAGHDLKMSLDRQLREAGLSSEAASFTRTLVEGVSNHEKELDRLIEIQAPVFPLAEMAPVDRNVLRLAIFEINFDNHPAPLPVVINEAVELAKGYGSESSGRFVHGVLGAIVNTSEREAFTLETDSASSEPVL